MLNLDYFSSQLQSLNSRQRPLLIALSGGVDSVVLTHLCGLYRQQNPEQSLAAVHVHHGLQREADDWLQFCQAFCENLQIPFFSHRVKVAQGPRLSLEEQARKARYQVFSEYAEQGYVIVCGHHQDDQVETLLLNLNRGSGVAGLAAMPEKRPLAGSALIRPLLSVSRQAIEAYAAEQQLQHIEDPSNQDVTIERNFVRRQVLPVLRERWPGFQTQAAQSCQLLGEALTLQNEIAELDSHHYVDANGWLANDLSPLSHVRQVNLIRYWIRQQAGVYPSQAQLHELQHQMFAAEDTQPQIVLNHGGLRRHQHRWCWCPTLELERCIGFNWLPPYPSVDLATGSCLSQLNRGWCRKPQAGELVSVRFRHEVGNPRMRPQGRQGSRNLKKLLQELAIPTWLRDGVPLIYYGEQWVALAQFYIDESVAVAEDGIEYHWECSIWQP